MQITKTVAFCSLTFGLGGMVLGGAILFLEPRAVPFFGAHLPRAAMYGVGALLWAIVLGYVTFARVLRRVRLFGQTIELPGVRMAVLQVLLATVDVAITATIFYQLLPTAPHLTWLIFLGVYVASYTAGLADQPARRHRRVRHRDAARPGALYRRAAHRRRDRGVPPLLLRHPAVPRRLAVRRQRDPAARRACCGSARPACRRCRRSARWSEPDFAVASSTGSVALCGVLLLCLGVLAPQTDFSWLDPDLAGLANQAGQFVPSLIGAGLVMMAIGLSHRVNLAWGLTLAAAGRRRGLHRDAGRPALGRRRADPDRPPGRAVPRLLLSPRQPAQRPAGGVQRALPGRAGDLPAGAGGDPPLHARPGEQRLVGGDHLARGAELAAPGGRAGGGAGICSRSGACCARAECGGCHGTPPRAFGWPRWACCRRARRTAW